MLFAVRAISIIAATATVGLLAAFFGHTACAMTFTLRDGNTLEASGPIEAGDAARFSTYPIVKAIELNSPGGLVSEALAMSANMDKRGGVETVVKPGASCASACAMALFVSGARRIVLMGGRLGIHSCRTADGTPAIECNKTMAANAVAHGVPWGVIEGFGNYTKPSDMHWLEAEEAECWGLMKWHKTDTSNSGMACFKWMLLKSENRVPEAVTTTNADDIVCRLNARTSSMFVASGDEQQGFSDVYRTACEKVAFDLSTPKYAAIDILLWLSLSDPNITKRKPGSLLIKILRGDEAQAKLCWKCMTVMGMSALMRGYPQDAVRNLQGAMSIMNSPPAWLASRRDLAAREVLKAGKPGSESR